MASSALNLPEMRRCIHCLSDKDESHFNRDHVVPDGLLPPAFGATQESWVLHCVCRDCNQQYGDDVELAWMRDSLEGYDRFLHGVRKPSQYRPFGKRAKTVIEYGEDSPVPGAKGYFVQAQGGTELGMTIAPQLGFGQSEESPLTWFDLGKLPSGDELKALGRFMQTRGEADLDEVATLLKTRGLSFEVTKRTDPPKGVALVEVVFTVARPQFRAITKMALNYVAAVFGPNVALDPALDPARRFARYDEGKNPVRAGLPRNRTQRLHYISVQSHAGRLVAHVSLFMRVRYYVVELAANYVGQPLASAHFFNLERGTIEKAAPIPMVDD